MPGLDRTGPEGKGSRTGREQGKCKSGKEHSEKTGEHSQRYGLGRGLRREKRHGSPKR